MLEVVVLFLLGGFWILFASIEDLRTREVANWISFSLVIFALGFRFFWSFFNNDFNFLYQGLLGFVVFFILGFVFYYARLFAGGDAKLFIALGPILGFSGGFFTNVEYFLVFLFLFLLCGAVYGLIFTIYLSLKNFNSFKKQFRKEFRKRKVVFWIFVFLGVLFFFLGFVQELLFIFGMLIILFPALVIYARAVDNSCMVKEISTKNLTEGDWLYEKIKIGREILKPNWEGLSKKEILKIKKHYKKIKVREGIAFVPVFFFSYVLYFYVFIEGLWNTFW